MVLEQIIPARWIERKSRYAFFLGGAYAFIGIIIAKTLFPADPSLVAVAFTSILLLPLLRKLFTIEERQEKHEKKFSIKRLVKDEGDFLKVYFLLAAGIFLVYCLAAMILPGFQVNTLFRDQLELRGATGDAIGSLAGNATNSLNWSGDLFWRLLSNNWLVLLACFILSFFAGDGAIFLITWNASLWGTIFGVTARNAAMVANTNPWWFLILVFLVVLPHAIIEMLSYLLAGIAGGLFSADIELDDGEKPENRFKKVFYSYTGTIILAAILFLLLGAIVETYVLMNASTYERIVSQSFMFT